jgi:hypothetical protein
MADGVDARDRHASAAREALGERDEPFRVLAVGAAVPEQQHAVGAVGRPRSKWG